MKPSLPRSAVRIFVAALLALSGEAGTLRAASSGHQLDYQIKAAYIYNFAKFVQWPPPPLAGGREFRVGVLGDPDSFAIIADTLRGKQVGGHPLEVVLLGSDAQAASCRVVFILRTSSLTPAQFHAHLRSAPVLLVGEKEGFAEAGGDIGFVPRGDNLRYQVNLAAAQQAGLRLSGQLANLAELVRGPAQ
ncbi:MAG TPA: YfiR family protein [Opitutaceae bacterium]